MLSQFKNFLEKAGFQIKKEDEDKSLLFEFENLNVIFVCNPSEPDYFRLLLPRIYSFDKNNKERVCQICDEYNQKFKVAKLWTLDNYIWVAAEQFAYSFDNIDSLFMRCLRILDSVYNDLKNTIKENENEDGK